MNACQKRNAQDTMLFVGTQATAGAGAWSPRGQSSAAAAPLMTAAAPRPIVNPIATLRWLLRLDSLSQTCVSVASLWQTSS